MKKTKFTSSLILFLIILYCSLRSGAGENPSADVTILENGVYFNGKFFAPFREMVLKDGKIASIENAESKTKGNRIALNGKYVIPGLIDAHEHIAGCPTYPYVMTDWKLNANSALLCGVTMLVDLFYQEDQFKAAQTEMDKSPSYYSTVKMAGPILTAPGGHGTEYGVPTRTITSVAEATKITNEVIDHGVDVIKAVYEADESKYIPSIDKDMLKAIVGAAHKRNKKVFVHIDRAAQAADCADVGVDVLAHMPADLLTDPQLKKIKASGMIIIPTITVMQSMMEGMDAKYMSDTLLWSTANPDYLSSFSHDKTTPPIPIENMRRFYPTSKYRENLSNCIKMKIPILAGTDAGNYAVFYGYSLHNEIMQYTLAGMSSAEALCTATQNISMVFPGIKVGKIEPGYDADIVVLNADPLKDINNTKSINTVFHKGRQVKNLIDEKAKDAAVVKPLDYDPAVFDVMAGKTLPTYVTNYSDSMMGGSSVINSQIQKDATGAGYIHLSGKVVVKGYVGFASLGFALGKKEDTPPVDISGYNAIEFDTKGNGETYYLLLISSLVKDYNFHTASFTTGKEWKTIRIPFDDAKQNKYYGKQISLDLKTIQAVTFSATGKDYDIDFDLKNIHLVKK